MLPIVSPPKCGVKEKMARVGMVVVIVTLLYIIPDLLNIS